VTVEVDSALFPYPAPHRYGDVQSGRLAALLPPLSGALQGRPVFVNPTNMQGDCMATAAAFPQPRLELPAGLQEAGEVLFVPHKSRGRQWQTGDLCKARFRLDGKLYDAVIQATAPGVFV